MIVNEVRYGKLPATRGYKGTDLIYKYDNGGIDLLDCDVYNYTNSLRIKCENGVIYFNGNTGYIPITVRLTHSIKTGMFNFQIADSRYELIPAGKTVTINLEIISGSCSGDKDACNLILRDSSNNAVVNCKYNSGMTTATATSDKTLSLFFVYIVRQIVNMIT